MSTIKTTEQQLTRRFKFGQNLDTGLSASLPVDIISATGLQYWPAAEIPAADVDIVSSLAADAPAGTGAEEVHLVYIDGSGVLYEETVALAGLTIVHPTNPVYRMFVMACGSVGTGGVNAGNITCVDATGTLAYIAAGKGRTLQATYTVPKGAGAELRKVKVSLAEKTAGWVNFVLFSRSPGESWTVRIADAASEADSSYVEFGPGEVTFDALDDIRLTVIGASGNNLKCNGMFTLAERS